MFVEQLCHAGVKHVGSSVSSSSEASRSTIQAQKVAAKLTQQGTLNMSVLYCLSFCATPWFLRASSRFSSSARASTSQPTGRCTLAKGWRSSYRPVVMEFSLIPLPFERDALQPHMSKETLDHHWGNHHRACVDNLNKQIIGTDLEGMELEDLYKLGYNNGNPAPYFNDAGLVWNHEFFWESIRPGGGKKPSGELLRLLERDFGSYETFVDEFKQAAATQFGSGWTWLVAMQTDPRVEGKYGKLVIEKTPNALNPLLLGHIPLLTIDLWEHAYYLDFQNRLPDFISTFINELISWDMVVTRLERAKESIDLSDAIFTDEDFEDPWNPVEIEKDEEMSDDDIELDDEDVDEGMDELS